MTRMKTPLSPSDIEVLLWYHCRPEPHERQDAPAVAESRVMFIECEMLEPLVGKDLYGTTAKGAAMVDMLCHAAEPRCVWIGGDGTPLGVNR